MKSLQVVLSKGMDSVRFSLYVGYSARVLRDRGYRLKQMGQYLISHFTVSMKTSIPLTHSYIVLLVLRTVLGPGKGSAAPFKWMNKGVFLIPVERKVSTQPW